MKVLVIGGNRYFGKRLVNLLIERGDEVAILNRGPSPFGPSVLHLQADRTQKSSLERALGVLHFDAVVDQICFTPREAAEAIEVFRGRTQYYVMTSTLSVYDEEGDIKEERFNPAINFPGKRISAYGEGKRAAENQFSLMASFPCAFARFPVVLGEDDYTKRLTSQIEKVEQGLPLHFPNLTAKFSFIHSQDAARALMWLVDHKKAGPYNFSAPDTITLGELLRMMERATSKSANLTQDPAFISPYGIEHDFYMNVEKARSEGFEAWRLSEWLERLINKKGPS